MFPCWRWFGPNDPVTLSTIRQAGALGIVTALHEVPVGTVWPSDDILARKRTLELGDEHRFRWAVAESIPVHENIKLGKAGRNRWLGKRPQSRGVAMNPVDHPHGGGEGKSSGGRHPVTPWGVPTKGYKTRSNKRTDRFIVRRRTK